jgi:hypothetical protein
MSDHPERDWHALLPGRPRLAAALKPASAMNTRWTAGPIHLDTSIGSWRAWCYGGFDGAWKSTASEAVAVLAQDVEGRHQYSGTILALLRPEPADPRLAQVARALRAAAARVEAGDFKGEFFAEDHDKTILTATADDAAETAGRRLADARREAEWSDVWPEGPFRWGVSVPVEEAAVVERGCSGPECYDGTIDYALIEAGTNPEVRVVPCDDCDPIHCPLIGPSQERHHD